MDRNPSADLVAAFETWFDREVPDSKIWDLSGYDLGLMAFMAGHREHGPDTAKASAMLHQVILRMQLRVDSGKENVAIGQHFAGEIVAACKSAISALKAEGLTAPAVRRAHVPR